MKRLPTLDETEAGYDTRSAYFAGDTDALDAIDAADARAVAELLAR